MESQSDDTFKDNRAFLLERLPWLKDDVSTDGGIVAHLDKILDWSKPFMKDPTTMKQFAEDMCARLTQRHPFYGHRNLKSVYFDSVAFIWRNFSKYVKKEVSPSPLSSESFFHVLLASAQSFLSVDEYEQLKNLASDAWVVFEEYRKNANRVPYLFMFFCVFQKLCETDCANFQTLSVALLLAINSCKEIKPTSCSCASEPCSIVQHQHQSLLCAHAIFQLPVMGPEGRISNKLQCLESWKMYGHLDQFQYNGYVILAFLQIYADVPRLNHRISVGEVRSFISSALACFPASLVFTKARECIYASLEDAESPWKKLPRACTETRDTESLWG